VEWQLCIPCYGCVRALAVKGQQGQGRRSDAGKRGMWGKVRRSLACADVVARWAALRCYRRVVQELWCPTPGLGWSVMFGTERTCENNTSVAKIIYNGRWTMDFGACLERGAVWQQREYSSLSCDGMMPLGQRRRLDDSSIESIAER
jgi:hypothetical protein